MTGRRRSGVVVPLFSLTSTRSWGVGEFADLPVFVEERRSAGVGIDVRIMGLLLAGQF